MEDENKAEAVNGTVIFLKWAAGTKSESVQPFLYVDRNTVVRISLKGDNPFEHKGLDTYDGKRVAAAGTRDQHSGVLMIDSIKEVSDDSKKDK